MKAAAGLAVDETRAAQVAVADGAGAHGVSSVRGSRVKRSELARPVTGWRSDPARADRRRTRVGAPRGAIAVEGSWVGVGAVWEVMAITVPAG
jgi:hypothetical protein